MVKFTDRNKIAELALFIASIILAFAFTILFLSSVSFLLKGTITSLQFILSLSISLCYCLWNSKSSLKSLSRKHFLWGCILFLSTLVASMIISGIFYDISWDGQAYHQEAILKLKEGWNPFWEKILETKPNTIWLNHYAKATWILAAATYQVTHQIETTKIFNILFIVSSFLMASSAILLSSEIRKLEAIVIALLMALNPVSIYQSLSFYVDGQVASLLLSLGCLSYLLSTKINYAKILIPLLVFNVCILVNIKFTAVIYTLVFIFGLIVWLFISRSRLFYQIFWAGLLSLCIGLSFIGYNPYVRNTAEMGHPFYPIYGSNPIDIISIQIPKNFSSNSFKNLFLSVFSKSDDLPSTTAELKIPLTFNLSEIRSFFNVDVRTGGFGPLFSGAIIISLIIFCMTVWGNFTRVKGLLFMVCILLLSVFINPQSWWARYAPQLWLVAPFSLILATISCRDTYLNERSLKILCKFLVLTLSVNIFLISGAYFYQNAKSSLKITHQLRDLSNAKNSSVVVHFKAFASNRARFIERGINFSEVPDPKELPCVSPLTFVHSSTSFCLVSFEFHQAK